MYLLSAINKYLVNIIVDCFSFITQGRFGTTHGLSSRGLINASWTHTLWLPLWCAVWYMMAKIVVIALLYFLSSRRLLSWTYQEIAVKYNGQKSFYIGSKCFFNIAFDAVSLCAHSVCLFPGILISRDSFSTTDSRKKFQVQISYCRYDYFPREIDV